MVSVYVEIGLEFLYLDFNINELEHYKNLTKTINYTKILQAIHVFDRNLSKCKFIQKLNITLIASILHSTAPAV